MEYELYMRNALVNGDLHLPHGKTYLKSCTIQGYIYVQNPDEFEMKDTIADDVLGGTPLRIRNLVIDGRNKINKHRKYEKVAAAMAWEIRSFEEEMHMHTSRLNKMKDDPLRKVVNDISKLVDAHVERMRRIEAGEDA